MYPKQVIRYISGQYSQDDEKFVRQWLAEDPSRRKSLRNLEKVWELTGNLDLGDVDQAWFNLSEYILKKHNKTVLHRVKRFARKAPQKNPPALQVLLKIAAVLLVIAGAYGFYRHYGPLESVSSGKTEVSYQTVSSDKGERLRFRFNDGTKVVLNASSQIRYRDDFGKENREIYLEGEAYFEVNHEHPLPFIVNAKDARIEDIGTKFNINAYPEREDAEIVVSEGKVRVSALQKEVINKGDKAPPVKEWPSVIVSQGEKVKVIRNIYQLNVQKANLHEALGWLQKQLIFDAEPLQKVAERLERYYDIKVEVTDTSLYSKKVTASFENERMENVLKVLAISMDAGYELNNDNVKFFIKK